ncbi:hypothetical protein OH77DRAFT_571295 [Trametes cingulata]|nr:hypothetical protein OH77DRAFT_571295 [Trametes cingulata]
MSPIVAARVLGYALLYAPHDAGRDALVRDILACDGDLDLGVLAHLYLFGLIRLFFDPKPPTRAVTPRIQSSLLVGGNCTGRARRPATSRRRRYPPSVGEHCPSFPRPISLSFLPSYARSSGRCWAHNEASCYQYGAHRRSFVHLVLGGLNGL